MKKLLALVSTSVFLLQVGSISLVSAQMPAQQQQIERSAARSADTYNRNGNVKYRSRDFQGAIVNYNTAIHLNPQFAGAYANQGMAKLQLGDKDGAVFDWKKASDLYRQQGNMSRYEALLARINKFSATTVEEEPMENSLHSASQLKDLKPTDPYYQAVQSLVERYGVMYAYQGDNTFHAERQVTRRQLVLFLNRSLDRLYELKNATSRVRSKRSCSDKPLTSNQTLCSQYSLYKNNVNSVSHIKDVKPSDDYFADMLSLVDDYGIKIIDTDNNFRFSKPVTKQELYDVMNGVFKLLGITLGSTI